MRKNCNKVGFDKDIAIKAIRIAAGTEGLVHTKIFDAIVRSGSQNSTTLTCFVDSVDSTIENLEVRYNLVVSDGTVSVPDDLSTVTVAMTSFTDPYIVKFSDLKSKIVGIGSQQHVNDGVIQSFYYYGENEGSFGGMIKSVDPINVEAGLLKALNNLQDDVNNLKTLLSTLLSTTINTASAGSADLFQIALHAGLASYLSQSIPRTGTSDIENPHLIHGLKILPS